MIGDLVIAGLLAASMIHSIRNGFPIVLLFVHQVLARFP